MATEYRSMLRLKGITVIIVSFVISLFMMFFLSSCQPKVGKIQDKTYYDMLNSNNDFAWNLYREASESSSFIVSPVSVTYLLSLTLNGTEGNTYEEIKKTLGWEDMCTSAINAFCYRFMNEELARKDSVLSIANYLALKKGISFNHSFVKKARSIYDAQVENLDFSKPENASHINDWCRKHTDGMIPNMIDRMEPAAVSYLLNAINFNGKWAKPFLTLNTELKTFYGINYHKKDINMMTSDEEDFPYMADSLLSAINLSYKGGKYSMIFLLPQKNHSLREIKGHLNQQRFLHILRQMKTEKNVDIWIPKFTIDKQIPLKEILPRMGITSMFAPLSANFKLLTDQSIYVSDMQQKARIEISENGTKAAAATEMECVTLGLFRSNNRKIFHAVHPFIYVIRDNENGALLFIGQYTGI